MQRGSHRRDDPLQHARREQRLAVDGAHRAGHVTDLDLHRYPTFRRAHRRRTLTAEARHLMNALVRDLDRLDRDGVLRRVERGPVYSPGARGGRTRLSPAMRGVRAARSRRRAPPRSLDEAVVPVPERVGQRRRPSSSVSFAHVTRFGNLSTSPLRPPSLYSSGCIDISRPAHSVKPRDRRRRRSPRAARRGERAAGIEQLITKLWLSAGSCDAAAWRQRHARTSGRRRRLSVISNSLSRGRPAPRRIRTASTGATPTSASSCPLARAVGGLLVSSHRTQKASCGALPASAPRCQMREQEGW